MWALTRTHLEYYVQFWTPQFVSRMDKLEYWQTGADQEKNGWNGEGLETMFCEERLKQLCTFTLEMRHIRVNMVTNISGAVIYNSSSQSPIQTLGP